MTTLTASKTGATDAGPRTEDEFGALTWSILFVLSRELDTFERPKVRAKLDLKTGFIQTEGTTWLVLGADGPMDEALARAVTAAANAVGELEGVDIVEARMVSLNDAERNIDEGTPVRYYGVTECARALGVTRQRVRQLQELNKLPEPDALVGGRPVWEERKFTKWAAKRALQIGATPLGKDPGPVSLSEAPSETNKA
jgi:hypothetical protein